MIRTTTTTLILATTLAACSDAFSPLTPDAVAADARPGVLVLNEVAASGDPDDWFEVVNTGEAPVELAAYGFIDNDDAAADAVAFPTQTLLPGDYLVQVVSDATAGFALGADEEVWIFRLADRALVDGINWADGDAPAGTSLARSPDGSGAFVTTFSPTPGAPNP